MSRLIRVLFALVLATALAACGDDDAGDEAASSTTGVDTTTTREPVTTSETTTSSTPAGDGAEDPPETEVPADEGMGDPLVFAADLTGDTEVPGPGDPHGTGRIEIESTDVGEWCIDMEVVDLASTVVDAHIHFGPAGRAGDVVIPIGAPTATSGDTDTWTDVCVTVEERLVNEVLASPDSFYANVHTERHPDGAVRGQLALSSIFELELS